MASPGGTDEGRNGIPFGLADRTRCAPIMPLYRLIFLNFASSK